MFFRGSRLGRVRVILMTVAVVLVVGAPTAGASLIVFQPPPTPITLPPGIFLPPTPGTLDSSFGSNGLVSTNLQPGTDTAVTSARQADGRLVVAASTGIVRYNANGSIDTTFGDAGRIPVPFAMVVHRILAVTVGGQPKLLLGGSTDECDNCTGSMAVARLNADGSVDTSFGTSGKATANINWGATCSDPVPTAVGRDMAVQSDGKIVVAGYAFNPGFSGCNGSLEDFAAVRFNADGKSLDSTFGNAGTQHTDAGYGEEANSLAIQSDGKIVLAGRSFDSSGRFHWMLVRYTSTGAPDTSFGSGGTVIDDPDGTTTSATDHEALRVVQAGAGGDLAVGGNSTSGHLMLARYSLSNGSRLGATARSDMDTTDALVYQSGKLLALGTNSGNFALARFNSDGTLDTTFGSSGEKTTDFGGTDSPADLAPTSSGSLTAVGSSAPSSGGSMLALAGFTSAGATDTTFGSGGTVTTILVGTNDQATVLAGQSDGKLVAAGTSSVPGSAAAAVGLERYNTNGQPDTSFGSSGTSIVNALNAFNAHVSDIAIGDDGKIWLAVTSTGAPELIKLDSSGHLDSSFGASGQKTIPGLAPGAPVRLVLLSDGKLLVGSSKAQTGTGVDFLLTRLNADGTTDNSFGTSGLATADLSAASTDQLTALAITADGHILAAGTEKTNGRFGVARFDSSGNLDKTFGTNGVSLVEFGHPATLNDMALGANGEIALAGSVTGIKSGGATSLAVARLNPDGTPDPGFGSGGTQTASLSSANDVANAVVVQGDGKVLVAGNAGNDIGLARFTVSGSLDPAFNGNGQVTTAYSDAHHSGANAMVLGSDGRPVIAGSEASTNSSGFPSGSNFALARYIGGPPQTQLTGGPSGTTTSTSATFTFISTEAGSTFTCSLDGATAASCTSPKTFTGLAPGSHTFLVRATDAERVVDSAGVSRTWTIASPPAPSGGASSGGSTGGSPSGAPSSGSGGGTSSTTPLSAPALVLSLSKTTLSRVLRSGLTVNLHCSAGCSAVLTALIPAKLARRLHLSKSRRPFVIGRSQASITASGGHVVLHFTPRLRRALGRTHRLTFTLTSVVSNVNSASLSSTSSRGVTLSG
jgi:uncharacterized delta-60 repeat protein